MMTPTPSLPPKTETLVIGGGLLGLSTALDLSEAGRDVVLIEAGKFFLGPSSISGGQLWPGFQCPFSEMKKSFGDDLTLTTWNMVHETLRSIHSRIATREDQCDFRSGVLLASKTEKQARWIEEEAKVFHDSGLDFVRHVSAEEICKNFVNTRLYRNGLLYEGTEGQLYGHLNPAKYVQTVLQLAQERGVRLAEDAPAQQIRVLSGGGYLVTTPKGEVKAANIVLATGADFLRPKGVGYDLVPRTYVPVRTVILMTDSFSEELARDMIPGEACFCDASDVGMNYGRLVPDPETKGRYRLTFGGADALAQIQIALEIRKIEKEMRAMFPQLDRNAIKTERNWSGRCDLSRTSLPVLLNSAKGFYHASGFSGQGMVNTALYGRAIAEKIISGTSEKFNALARLNPAPYANTELFAWLQAARTMIPKAFYG